MEHWRAVDEDAGLFALDTASGDTCLLRSTALKLLDGSTVVVGPALASPTKSFDELKTLGSPSFLLAPNAYHNMGLKRYSEQFPDAQTVSSETSSPRLTKVCKGIDIGGLSSLREQLPAHASIMEPPGTRSGEVWLRVEGESGVTWVVGDAFFNYDVVPLGAIGVITWLFAIGPGLRIGSTFRYFALKDRASYGPWLKAQLEADRPTRLVPAHGEIRSGVGLPETLIELANRHFKG